MYLNFTEPGCFDEPRRFSLKHSTITFLMRVCLFYTLLVMLSLQLLLANSEKSQALDSINVTVELRDENLKKLFKQIENQTGLMFAYQPQQVDCYNRITLPMQTRSVKATLDIALEGTLLEYRQVNTSVIIFSEEEAEKYQTAVIETPDITISGTVMDAAGSPIPGVNIIVKGTTKGTTTDTDGRYSLTVLEADVVLVFTFIGYTAQEVAVNGRSVIDIALVEDVRSLEEVVVIGYGEVKRSELTGAVATLDAKDINTLNHRVVDGIQGKVSGVTIEAMGGDPGADMRIQIRGAGSLSNNTPLVLIDGVPGSMSMLNPGDVKSIQVLKDASASAIYGSRAANGVVLVETKAGSKGDVTFSAGVNYGIQQLGKKLDLLNAEEWRMVNTDARAAAGLPPADFLTELAGSPLPVEGTDWQDAMYVTAPIAKYNVSAMGGTENVKYNVSLGYIDQEGIVQVTKYNQLNLLIKTDFTKGKFEFGESLVLSKDFRNNTPQDGGGRGNVVESAVMANPNTKIYRSEYTAEQLAIASTPVGSGGNVIGLLNLDTDQAKSYRIFLSTYGQYEILPGLKYKLSIGSNNTLTNSLYARPIYSLQDVYAMGTQSRAQDGEMRESNAESNYWTIANTLNYQKEFGHHSVNLLLGQSSEKSEYRSAGGTVFNLPNGVQVLGAGGRNPTVFGNSSANSIVSYFGRAIYSYDSRYIVTATVRRDGSSRFSPNNKYGTFPSLGVAWNASNESFLKILPAVSLLKLRASYGVLGNESIGNYQFLGLIQPAYTMVIGSDPTLWTGAIQTNYPATNIKWESTATSNFGVDFGMWNGRLDFTFDYFNKTTTDLLLRIPIPYSVGAGSDPYGNAGKITNKGFETLLSYNAKVRDFNLTATGTFSRIRNKVVELSTVSQQLSGAVASLHGGAPVNYTRPGYPIYSFFLIQTDGLFRSAEEVAAHSKDGELIQKNAAPGDIRFVDANDDGIIDGNDRIYSGSAFPDFDYGLRLDANWKMFDLSVLFQGTQGNKIYNAFKTYIESVRAGNNYTTKVLDSYTYNPNGNFPRLIVTDPNGNGIDNSTQFLEDGSYFRLKTITLGFNFPEKWMNSLSISNAKFYIGAQNLLTLTEYEGYNPDIGGGGWQGSGLATRGNDYSNYPLAKSYHVGLQLNF